MQYARDTALLHWAGRHGDGDLLSFGLGLRDLDVQVERCSWTWTRSKNVGTKLQIKYSSRARVCKYASIVVTLPHHVCSA